MPASIQTGQSGTSLFPPDDMLVSNTGTHNGQFVTGAAIQDYGNESFMIRQPFSFTSRTGTIVCYVDAWSPATLGHYVQLAITADPVPCPTYLHGSNDESGPVPRQGVFLPFRDLQSGQTAGTRINIANAYVYDAYAKTALTPSTNLTGASAPATLAGSLNRIEVRISTSLISVYMSDYFNGTDYPNSDRLVWESSASVPFSVGYVHFATRNHATIKYMFPITTGVRYWDNISFDGPVMPVPRAYEIPDNTTTNSMTDDPTEGSITVMNVGYRVSDGSAISEGVWSPTALVSPLTFNGSVNLTGATSAQLTLNMFVFKDGTPAVTTSTGLKYKLNGGTWRTRLLTSDEVAAINGTAPKDVGASGMVGLLIDVTLGDVVSGTNTIDFSMVSASMGYYPMVCNIDLLVYTS
jgi:hypothetical protein